ncbi:MAG TPA: hypothetical protein EYN26_05225 [Chromatiales bacterium]|jgi:hypothetical protein|nr:hypothetical protein [Chromatiaceae bacterium]HIB84170.1 hypothetical protein [Chromatiaceae bacterium]HIN82500.1 hypothetical protein [Chromatiales bacterium]HIO14939.1 hypothetical protein [Chromatiales bacterium]HIO54527.1 hypothetical protein [Chromatiales bacterium]
MSDKIPSPGISRENRVGEEGLSRLRAHLERNAGINPIVLTQWIRRYGDDARQLLKEFDRYSEAMEP